MVEIHNSHNLQNIKETIFVEKKIFIISDFINFYLYIYKNNLIHGFTKFTYYCKYNYGLFCKNVLVMETNLR